MPLIFIGKSDRRKVFATPYSLRRLKQRNMSFEEVLEVLAKRDASYPIDEEGRQKIRTTLGKNRRMFLTILEDSKKIIVITGGEA